MKVCMVIEYYVPHAGGGVILFQELAERLVAKGHEVHVVTALLKNTKNFEIIKGVNVHRTRVPLKGDRYWFTYLSIPKVIKVAKNCDVIHACTYNGAFPAWVAAKVLKKPSILTFLEIFGKMWKNLSGMNRLNASLHAFLEYLIVLLRFDKVICISRYTKNTLRLLGVPDERLEGIYIGIDYNLFSSNNSGEDMRNKLCLLDNFVYMSYGRAGISKGFEYLIRAVPLISQKIPNSKLLLILSQGDRYEVIKKMIHDLRIEDHIILSDPVRRQELPNYIGCSDCVVIPSLAEGFGLTAAEACAMEKPVVATDIGSLPEVVSGRYVLIEPKNPDAIVEGVEKIYKGEVEYKGKKIFSWGKCVKGYLKVYRVVLK